MLTFIKDLALVIVCYLVGIITITFFGVLELLAIGFMDSHGVLSYALVIAINAFFGYALINTFAPRILEFFGRK